MKILESYLDKLVNNKQATKIEKRISPYKYVQKGTKIPKQKLSPNPKELKPEN